MAMQGMEFPALVYAKPPKMQRVEVNVQGQQIVQAYDGETAWWINPFMGGAEPQPMPAEMAEMMTEQEFESPFIDYQKKGYTAELLGETTVEGAAVYEVKLTKKENDEEFYYFDKDDGVIIMSKKAAKSGPTKGQFAETYYSDYQEVGDFVLPFFLEVKMAGQSIQKMTFKNYEINPEIDDAIFAFPKK
jgi:outer membrane lipoprotein-sorting protein